MKTAGLVILIVLGVPLLATAGLGAAASRGPINIAGKQVTCNWGSWDFSSGTAYALTTSGCSERTYQHIGPFEIWG